MEWLPRYAPELNPIEATWRDLKRYHLAHRTFQDTDNLDLLRTSISGWVFLPRTAAMMRLRASGDTLSMAQVQHSAYATGQPRSEWVTALESGRAVA